MKVFAKNIPYDYSLDKLKDDLKNINGITNILLPLKNNNLTKGYCIITFDNELNMENFIKLTIYCSDRILKFEKYMEHIKIEKLFIINVIGVYSQKDLENIFFGYKLKKCFICIYPDTGNFIVCNKINANSDLAISEKPTGKGIVEFTNKKDYDYFISLKKFKNYVFKKFC